MLSSEKCPSSKTNRNSQPSSPSPRIECGRPAGKYHRSPLFTSSIKTRSVWIQHRDASTSVEHDGPLVRCVPVQLAKASSGETHVSHPRDRWKGEIALRHSCVQPPFSMRLCARSKEYQIGPTAP